MTTELNVRRDFGAKGNGTADDTAAIQAAIDACCGSGDPVATGRQVAHSLYIPAGTYKLTAPLNIRSTFGFRLRGDLYATHLYPVFTGTACLDVNGASNGVIGGFRIEGDDVTEGLDAAISFHWDSTTAYRSSHGMRFHDITIWNTRCKAAITVNDDGSADQTDVTVWENINLSGDWYSHQSETTWWQYGFKFPAAYGNTVVHTIVHLASVGYRYGFGGGPCDTRVFGVAFGNNGTDVRFNGITSFHIEGVRSEHSQRAISSAGGGSSSAMFSAKNWLMTGNDVPEDGRVIDWTEPGLFSLEGFIVTADAGWDLPKMRFVNNSAPQTVHLSGCYTGSELQDLIETPGDQTRITVEGYTRTDPSNGSAAGQTNHQGVQVVRSTQVAASVKDSSRAHGETYPRWEQFASGEQRWGPGSTATDTTLSRSAVGVLASNGALKPAGYASGSRPSASTVGAGAMIYDTTLGKPIWSNGSVWKDAAGTTV